MTDLTVSSIHELNTAIESHNPFNQAAIAKTQSIWSQKFPDLKTLNARASDKVIELVQQVQTSKSANQKIASLTIVADVGSGKTHLIGRIRRHLFEKNRALFVYVNAGQYGDLDRIRSQFLKTLVSELARPGNQGVSQLQEIAASIANISNSQGNKTPATTIVKNFDKAYTNALKNKKNIIKSLSAKILKNKSELDPYLLRATLWTLSETYSAYAVQWLAGNELDRETAAIMGLPTNSENIGDQQESNALNVINNILLLAGECNPILICFDEFEAVGVISQDGFTKPQVMAGLIKDIYDNLEQSSAGQGAVLLSLMFDSTWKTITQVAGAIDASLGIGGGIRARMSTATKGQPILLEPLNSQSTIELVALWLKEELYDSHNLVPPYPTYPFLESQLAEVGKSRPTVREVLDWCSKNFKVDKPTKTPKERFNIAFKEIQSLETQSYLNLDSNEHISEILYFGFEMLIGENLDGKTASGQNLNQVVLKEIDANIKPINSNIQPQGLSNSNWINFKIKGTENGQDFSLGVAVVQETNMNSVGAALKRLMAYDRFGLTRGCIVRSEDKKINSNTQAYQLLTQFCTPEMGGEQVNLIPKDIYELATIYSIYKKGDAYNLTQEQVLEFSRPILKENDLLREILSDPSGIIDADTIQEQEEEEELEILFDESSDDITGDEEVDNLFNSVA